jgi:Flp pilus assembly protein TadG
MNDSSTVATPPKHTRFGTRLVRKLRKSDAGQALVEFSLVLPIMLLMLFALVDFGRGFYSWLVVTNAVREGARVGAVQATEAVIKTKVVETASGLDPTRLDPAAVTYDNAAHTRGSTVRVDVTYHFQYVTPVGSILHLVSGGTLSTPLITAHASMRLE